MGKFLLSGCPGLLFGGGQRILGEKADDEGGGAIAWHNGRKVHRLRHSREQGK